MTVFLIFYILYAICLVTGLAMVTYNRLHNKTQYRFMPVWLSAAMCFVPVAQGVSWGMEFSILQHNRRK